MELWPTLLLALLGCLCLFWRWRLRPPREGGAGVEATDSAALAAGPPDSAAASGPGPGPAAAAVQAPDRPSGGRALAAWMRRNRTEIAVIGLLGLAALYVWVFFPKPSATSRPGQIGSPFNGLNYMLVLARRLDPYWAPVVGGLVAALAAGLLLRARRAHAQGNAEATRSAIEAATLAAALGLLGLGQLALFDLHPRPALSLVPGLALAFVWAWDYRLRLAGDLDRSAPPRLHELALVGLVLGLTAFLRLYGLRFVPYGIEGDEAKWLVEVIRAMVYGSYPEGTELHLYTMPGSFFMQAPFHRLLGPGLYAGRLTVAVYSIVGSAAFYLLVRRLANVPVALLATFLLAVSPFDISASRLANVESHVKLLPLVALLLLEWATRSDRRLAYGLAGVATALALLTYDTILPLIAVSLLIIAYELVRTRRPRSSWGEPIAIYLAPSLLALPILMPYFAGRFGYYGVTGEGQSLSLGPRLAANAALLFESIFVVAPNDFLFGRPGPTFNALLLPWLLVGAVLALVAWRRQRMGWWAVFAILFFLPVPILARMPMARVLYPALPAAYALMAIALHAGYQELDRSFHRALRPVILALAGLWLASLAMSEVHIAFNQVLDHPDRQARRELLETAKAAGGPEATVLFAYRPAADAMEYERDFMIWLGMLRPVGGVEWTYPHAMVPLDDLMPALERSRWRSDRIELVFDAYNPTSQAEREAAIEGLLRCYPEARAHAPGRFYRRLTLPGGAEPEPGC